MPRTLNVARRVHSLFRHFPHIRRSLDSVGIDFHRRQENWDYNIETNGELWLLRALASRNRLRTVFDVGANHGLWTSKVLQVNPDASVHCFEICPPTFQKLLSQTSRFGEKVLLNSFGLSDSRGEIQIRYYPDGDEGTTMLENVELDLKKEILAARVDRGEDYCAGRGLKTIDLLKIDVEGAEHLVLKGFGNLLTPAKIPVVQFEYGMASIVTKFLLRDFYAFFVERGYRVGKLFPSFVRFQDYRYPDEDFLGPNYVAASPEAVDWLKRGPTLSWRT